jgi:hypothetical protein
VGACAEKGLLLKFRLGLEGSAVPDATVSGVVAHELAHVWVYATTPKRGGRYVLNLDHREDAANRIAEGWGYPRPTEWVDV